MTGVECGDTLDTCDVEDELDQVLFQQRGATFGGAEIAAQYDVGELWNGVWGIEGQYDFAGARFAGDKVPRISPHRLGGGVYYRDANRFARAGVLHAFDQNKVNAASEELATPGYTLVSAELAYTTKLHDGTGNTTEMTIGLKGENLADDVVLNHSSFKRREDAHLPGVSVRLFGQLKFNEHCGCDAIYPVRHTRDQVSERRATRPSPEFQCSFCACRLASRSPGDGCQTPGLLHPCCHPSEPRSVAGGTPAHNQLAGGLSNHCTMMTQATRLPVRGQNMVHGRTAETLRRSQHQRLGRMAASLCSICGLAICDLAAACHTRDVCVYPAPSIDIQDGNHRLHSQRPPHLVRCRVVFAVGYRENAVKMMI